MGEARTAELWLRIDQLHLKFLQAEETPAKLEVRSRLEGLVAEYLSLVPHDRKFVSSTTGDLITNSIKWRHETFSLAKAAEAFKAVEQYAANLINQPWRQEFWKIRQYSGFYKHQVEAAISGADKLFTEMGYVVEEAQVLALPPARSGHHPVSIDSVTSVARDCVLASVECSLLGEILAGVGAAGPVDLLEVAEFRRDHIGSVEQAIRELNYRKSQQRSATYQLPAAPPTSAPYLPPSSPYHALAYPSFLPQQTNGYSPHAFPTTPSNGFPTLPNLSTIPSLPSFPNHQNGFEALGGFAGAAGFGGAMAPNGGGFSPNGGVVQIAPQAYSPQGGVPGFAQPAPHTYSPPHPQQAHLGYSHGGGRGEEGRGAPGGVGRLEGGHQSAGSPAGSNASTLRGGQIPTTILELTAEPAVPERRGRGEGGARPREGRGRGARGSAGEQAAESWDYVYKQLETQGYTKDQAERPDVLGEGEEERRRREGGEEERRRRDTEVLMQEEVRRGLVGMKVETGRGEPQPKSRAERGRANRQSRHLETSESEDQSKYSSAVESDGQERMDYGRAVRGGGREARGRGGRGGEGRSQGGRGAMWECSTCTFHNAEEKNICDMCSKSRDAPAAQLAPPVVVRKEKSRTPTPPPAGLKCERCTLVNQPSARICAACDSTLGAPPV